MTELRWDAMVIDCRDPESLAVFWAALLDVEVRGRWHQYIGLQSTAPDLPRLVFQRVDDPHPAKTSAHLDFHVPSVADLPGAVNRAVSLGARLIEEQEQDGQSWRVLADPDGNLFCLVAG